MVISNYADSFSGFMGCAIAVPLSKYVLSDVKVNQFFSVRSCAIELSGSGVHGARK